MAIDAAKIGAPGEHYRIPADQRDPNSAARLAFIMQENGVEVLFSAAENAYYIPTGQPYGRFVKEMMGIQRYPKIRLVAGAPIVPPYDMTAWSLPLMMGVSVEKVILSKERQHALRELRESDWPRGEVKDGGASMFIVSHETNNASRLINAVLKEKGKVSLIGEEMKVGGKEFGVGSIVVEGIKDIGLLAKKYSLEIDGLKEKPTVSVQKLGEFRQIGRASCRERV